MEPLCILRGHHQHLPVTTPSGFGRVLGVVGGEGPLWVWGSFGLCGSDWAARGAQGHGSDLRCKGE